MNFGLYLFLLKRDEFNLGLKCRNTPVADFATDKRESQLSSVNYAEEISQKYAPKGEEYIVAVMDTVPCRDNKDEKVSITAPNLCILSLKNSVDSSNKKFSAWKIFLLDLGVHSTSYIQDRDESITCSSITKVIGAYTDLEQAYNEFDSARADGVGKINEDVTKECSPATLKLI